MPTLSILTICAYLLSPPTDDAVREQIDAYLAWQTAAMQGDSYSSQAMRARADQVFDALPIGELTAPQLAMLSFRSGPALRTNRVDEIQARLDTLAEAPTMDGAVAAMTLVVVTSYGEQAELLAATRAALDHPMIGEAISAGHGADMLQAVGTSVDRETGRLLAGAILELADDLPAQADEPQINALIRLLIMLARVVPPEQEDAYQEFRQAVTAIVSNSPGTARTPSTLRFLDGAFARLELLDHPLPHSDVLWSSDGLHRLDHAGPGGRHRVLRDLVHELHRPVPADARIRGSI